MPLTQLFHLSHQGVLQILVHHIRLEDLLLLDHMAHRISPVVVFHGEEDLLLLAHLNQILAITLLDKERFGNLLFVQDKLLLLLDLELLDKLKRRGLVLAHVAVPGFAELGELQLLG